MTDIGNIIAGDLVGALFWLVGASFALGVSIGFLIGWLVFT